MPLDTYGRSYEEFNPRRPGSGRWPRHEREPRLSRRTTYAGGMGNAQRCRDAIDHGDVAWLEQHATWWDDTRDQWRHDWHWVLPIRVRVHQPTPPRRRS